MPQVRNLPYGAAGTARFAEAAMCVASHRILSRLIWAAPSAMLRAGCVALFVCVSGCGGGGGGQALLGWIQAEGGANRVKALLQPLTNTPGQ